MKEIERKYTVDPKLSLDDILNIVKDCNYEKIKDFYFNPMTRLRFKGADMYMTIKSLMPSSNEDIASVRDEWEFTLNKSELDFIPSPMLIKNRYYFNYENQQFEINIYKDIRDRNHRNLVLVEIELTDKNQQIKLPEWIDHDVTHHPAFYNYNIYAQLLK